MTARTLAYTLALIITSLPSIRGQGTGEADARAIATDMLLSERGGIKALQRTIEKAREAGVPEQAILEARFLYHVDQLNDSAIAAMLPDFLKQQENFRLEDSAIFAIKEDWLSVLEYVKAIHALEKGDKEAFKHHIKEAFWLGPRQAAAFAPHIERLRHEEAMSLITIDLDTRLTELTKDDEARLGDILGTNKALLLHFWSPNSVECVMSMEDYAKTASMLSSHKIAAASICPEKLHEAQQIALKHDVGAWLVDKQVGSMGKLLRVQTLPTMTIITPGGKVLFSGDPTDDLFWKCLEELDKEIKRPDADQSMDD